MPIDLTSIKCDTCLECGYQNAEGARYCPKCNYSLPMPLTTKEFQNWTAPGADPLASVHAAVGIASEKINPGDLLTALRYDPHIENLLKTRDEAGIMEPRMGSEASAIIHRDTALAKAKDDASKITGVALTGGLAEDLVEGLYEEYQLPRIPSLPSLPIPSLPNFSSLPTFDLPVNANADGSRTVWVGLFRSDGNEVVAREYKRKPIKLFEGGSSENISFDTAGSKWGIVSAIGLFDRADSSRPLITFPLSGGEKNIDSGMTVAVNNIVFESAPSSYTKLTSVVSAKDNFEASGEEKARLKVKMSKAMGAMSKLKKEGL